MIPCAVTDCGKPKWAKGYCVAHYRRVQRTGSVEGRPHPIRLMVTQAQLEALKQVGLESGLGPDGGAGLVIAGWMAQREMRKPEAAPLAVMEAEVGRVMGKMHAEVAALPPVEETDSDY